MAVRSQSRLAGLLTRATTSRPQNSELFTLTYGALVVQLLNDLESVEDVNKHLDRMGYNIGVRLVEDFIARTSAEKCYDLRETADKLQVRVWRRSRDARGGIGAIRRRLVVLSLQENAWLKMN